MDVVKLIQESLFEACFLEMGIRASTMPPINSQMTAKGKKGGAEFDPNNVSMLSIPK